MTFTAPPASLLFVGSYAPAAQGGIHLLRLDEATGTLRTCDSFAGITHPAFVAVHPNGRWLYAASEASPEYGGTPGTVYALRFEPPTPSVPATLEAINAQRSGGDLPCHLCFDATGRWLFVSNYGTGSVSVLPIEASGALGQPSSFVQHAGGSVNSERQAGPHAHSVTVAPDNRFAIVADLGIDALVVYRFESVAGQLTWHARVPALRGAGPRHAAFHPNRAFLYVANELDSTVAVYAYAAARGALSPIQVISTLPGRVPESTVAHIQVAPDGQRVYVTNRGHDSLAVFTVAVDGTLERLAVPTCGGQVPRHFALSPTGRWLVVANQDSDAITVLPVDSGSSALGVACGQVPIQKPACVQFLKSEP